MEHPEPYRTGIQLFNQGAYWHAHEAWEELWMGGEGSSRHFLQGLIQVAAALVHWQRGNWRGVERNWAKARPKLLGTPSPYWGLDLGPLIEAMDSFVRGRSGAPPELRLEGDERESEATHSATGPRQA